MTTYNKLVRDRIPAILAEKGLSYSTRVLDSNEYSIELRTKLQEETNEYLEAKTSQEAVEELADILEVVYALAQSYDLTTEELEWVRAEKAEKRGGFEERIYLIEVKDA